MSINPTKPKLSTAEKHGHENHMGGVSYAINNPIKKLRIVASSCFFGEPKYYDEKLKTKEAEHETDIYYRYNEELYDYLDEVLSSIDRKTTGISSKRMMESAIDEALAFDPESTLMEAARLRNEENIRTTPQVIMVRAANMASLKGTSLVRKYADEIMKRTDDCVTQFAYQMLVYGKPIPNSLKKSWKSFLESKNEFSLAKYTMSNKMFKLVDVINMVHAKSEAIDKFMKGQVSLNEQTWESYISANGSNVEAWTNAVELMGHMSLLRNLRNLSANGVNEELYLNKLIEGVPNGKQLPFRYYSAYNALKESDADSKKIRKALSDCIDLSIEELPKFNGKLISLCDNSGSAHGTFTSEFGSVKVSDIANLSGVITASLSDDGYVGVFGDNLEVVKIKKEKNLLKTHAKINIIGEGIGHSTENGVWLFLDKAIKEKEHWDHIFIYSDMQAGHGGLYGSNPKEYSKFSFPSRSRYIDVAALIKEYRKKVNPNVLVYMVQVAGYNDTLAPEFYDKTYILGGWSAGIIRFAHEMSRIN